MTTKSIIKSAWAEDMVQFLYHLYPDTRKIKLKIIKCSIVFNKTCLCVCVYIYIYIYIWSHRYWSLSKLFCSIWQWLDIQGSIPGWIIPKTQKKSYLIFPCLTVSIIRPISTVKWSNQGIGVPPSPTPRCSSCWKRSFRVTHFTLIFGCVCVCIYIYIYICVCVCLL